VKTLFTLLLTFSGFWAFAQNNSENNVHSKDGKVYIEILVQQDEVESLLNDPEFCESGTSLSFCFRNYVNEKLDLAVNNGNKLDFIIEASLSNTKEIQINLSADSGQAAVSSYQITNNLFVDDIPTFKHEMKFTLNGQEQNIVLDEANRTANIN
jgi:hypothetical protein